MHHKPFDKFVKASTKIIDKVFPLCAFLKFEKDCVDIIEQDFEFVF